jgi:hypothetical protein
MNTSMAPLQPSPSPPNRVVVGGQVPARQAGPSFFHDEPSHVGDVPLEAASADVADGCAFLGDEQAGSGTAIGGSPDGHDRGERHPLATGGEGSDRREDVRDLTHGGDGTEVQMVAPVPIPAGMDDSFAFGKPSRKRSLPAAPRSKGPRADAGSGRGRIVAVAAAGVVVVLLVVGFMTFVKGSGEQIASGQQSVISQIGAAKDVEAQTTETAGDHRGPGALRGSKARSTASPWPP